MHIVIIRVYLFISLCECFFPALPWYWSTGVGWFTVDIEDCVVSDYCHYLHVLPWPSTLRCAGWFVCGRSLIDRLRQSTFTPLEHQCRLLLVVNHLVHRMGRCTGLEADVSVPENLRIFIPLGSQTLLCWPQVTQVRSEHVLPY